VAFRPMVTEKQGSQSPLTGVASPADSDQLATIGRVRWCRLPCQHEEGMDPGCWRVRHSPEEVGNGDGVRSGNEEGDGSDTRLPTLKE
jgi:hypothetical protein